MKRRTITHARLADQYAQKGGFRGRWIMVTPTYADEVQWEPGHIRHLVRRMRDWFSRQGEVCRYQWVMELTKRGRPHYHALIWVPSRLRLPQPDRAGWWMHGFTRTEVALNAVGYLAKYASKGICLVDPDGNPFKFPKGARICGGGGLDYQSRLELRWWLLPRWLREAATTDLGEGIHDLRRFGAFFVHPDSGMTWQSPWRFIGCSPGWTHLLFVKRDHVQPQPWEIDRTLPGPDVPF